MTKKMQPGEFAAIRRSRDTCLQEFEGIICRPEPAPLSISERSNCYIATVRSMKPRSPINVRRLTSALVDGYDEIRSCDGLEHTYLPMNEVVVDTRKDTAVRGVVRHALGTLSETGYTDRFRVEGREKLLYSYVLTDKGIDAHGILMAVLAMPPLVVRKVDSDGGGSLRTDGLTGILQRN